MYRCKDGVGGDLAGERDDHKCWPLGERGKCQGGKESLTRRVTDSLKDELESGEGEAAIARTELWMAKCVDLCVVVCIRLCIVSVRGFRDYIHNVFLPRILKSEAC